jgi:AraC-like DNA-binding protein
MNAIPLVRVNAILPFVNFLNQIGAPTHRLLNQAKLPVFALDEPEALISLYQGFAFIDRAARAEGIEDLGILVGQQTPIQALGMFGHSLSQALTMYDLLKRISNLMSAFSSGERSHFTVIGDQVWLQHTYSTPPAIATYPARCYGLMLYLNAIRLFTRSAWQPTAIYFQTNHVKTRGLCESCPQTQFFFNQPINAIVFSRSLLSLPLSASGRNHSSEGYPQAAYAIWQKSAPAPEFFGSLRQLLGSLMLDGFPLTIDLVAEASGMSVRSLQRRLTAAGLSYADLIDQLRFDQAIQLLGNPTLKLVEVAAELGYRDQANFTRAFKRWTGTSPHEFRRLHLQV